ncbi:MAG: hypothetical protein LBH40_01375 [Alphaproteobacteria bacterium]|jgi:hypothetical protein|nr:hypothetical protein [Alphaproteobacteria bacterium]
MKKYLCLFLFFTFSYTGIALSEEVDLAESLGTKYKLTKEADSLACFKPLAIKGIDTVYLKNKNDEVVYLIEIYGSEGNCKWQRDKVIFAKNLPLTERNSITKNFKPQLHFKGNTRLLFRVKKLLPTESVDIKSIKVPYFILINNKATNEVIFKKDLSININLPAKGEVVYKAEIISFELSFLMEDFVNLETLSGIYFKNK